MELNHFIFKLVSSEHVDALRDVLSEPETFKSYLSRIVGQKLDKELLAKHSAHRRTHLKTAFLDFLQQVGVLFMRKVEDSHNDKVSVGLHLVVELLLQSFAKHLTREQSSKLMCELVNRHSGEDPPRRFKVLALEDVRLLSSILVERFYFHYETFMQVFATEQAAVYRFAPLQTGVFPKSLGLEFGQKLLQPETHPLLKELYFSKQLDDELDELELEELMQGNADAKLTLKKKEAIIRKRLEAERKKVIEQVLEKKIHSLHKELGVQVDELRKEFDLTEDGTSPSK